MYNASSTNLRTLPGAVTSSLLLKHYVSLGKWEAICLSFHLKACIPVLVEMKGSVGRLLSALTTTMTTAVYSPYFKHCVSTFV